MHVKRMANTKTENCGFLKSSLKGRTNPSRIPIPSTTRNIPRSYSA